MDRPIQLVVLSIGLLVPLSREVSAEEPPSPKRERVVSPRMAEILSAAAPKFEPSAAPAAEGVTSHQLSAARARVTAPEITTPANTIIRLPEYIVREKKPKPLPKYEEVLVPRELEKLAMNEFLGPENGFDRGFLNLLTVADLWKKIPLLGGFPLEDFTTNKERAMGMYRADRNAKAWAEAMGLLTPAERAAISRPTGSAPPRK